MTDPSEIKSAEPAKPENPAAGLRWHPPVPDHTSTGQIAPSGQICPSRGADAEPMPGLTAEEAWAELVNVDDRTSPEEYPDHCLITFEELASFMERAVSQSA